MGRAYVGDLKTYVSQAEVVGSGVDLAPVLGLRELKKLQSCWSESHEREREPGRRQRVQLGDVRIVDIGYDRLNLTSERPDIEVQRAIEVVDGDRGVVQRYGGDVWFHG